MAGLVCGYIHSQASGSCPLYLDFLHTHTEHPQFAQEDFPASHQGFARDLFPEAALVYHADGGQAVGLRLADLARRDYAVGVGEIRILSGKSLVLKTARLVYEKHLFFQFDRGWLTGRTERRDCIGLGILVSLIE
jgi:hypothetical protein